MTFSHYLGIVMSTIILTILWLVVFGAYAIIMKLWRLPKLFAKAPESFWVDTPKDFENSMRYQF